MNIPNFFRILNNKIEQYNQMAVNPFTNPQPIVLIWVEEETEQDNNNINKQY